MTEANTFQVACPRGWWLANVIAQRSRAVPYGCFLGYFTTQSGVQQRAYDDGTKRVKVCCEPTAEVVRRVDLLWVNLCELGVGHEARARRRREVEEAARTGTSHAAHDPPKPIPSLKETLQSVSSHVRSLPCIEKEGRRRVAAGLGRADYEAAWQRCFAPVQRFA